MRISITKNCHNLSVYQIIEILLVFYNTYINPKNQNKFIFDLNNYINQNQFNQLFDLDQINKGIKYAYAIICKLKLVSIKVTNYRLEIIREEK